MRKLGDRYHHHTATRPGYKQTRAAIYNNMPHNLHIQLNIYIRHIHTTPLVPSSPSLYPPIPVLHAYDQSHVPATPILKSQRILTLWFTVVKSLCDAAIPINCAAPSHQYPESAIIYTSRRELVQVLTYVPSFINSLSLRPSGEPALLNARI